MVNIGYGDFFLQYREKVPIGTRKDFPNVKARVDGELPADIPDNLPILYSRSIGSSDVYALNSGGRGVLLTSGDRCYRFKGVDLDGSLTSRVAKSQKNQIADIRNFAQDLDGICFDTSQLFNGEVYNVPVVKGKPFSFFLSDSVQREKHACTVIGDEFNRRGFFRPYSFEADISYPQIQFKGEACHTLVFSLQSPESDLRFAEFYRFALAHLKFATPDELNDLSLEFGEFLSNLTSWHGFLTRVMADNKLAPTPDSHQNQNYVLSQVSESEIGISRVDHTSTSVNANQARQYAQLMDKHFAFFADQQFTLFHALELARHGYPLDEERYTGYFDRADKWHPDIHGKVDYNKIPGFRDYFNLLRSCFNSGTMGVISPVPIGRFKSFIKRISQIKIDEEKQERIKRNLEDALRAAGREDLIKFNRDNKVF